MHYLIQGVINTATRFTVTQEDKGEIITTRGNMNRWETAMATDTT